MDNVFRDYTDTTTEKCWRFAFLSCMLKISFKLAMLNSEEPHCTCVFPVKLIA